MQSELAILGGPRAVVSSYRYHWPVISQDIERAVLAQLHDTVSIYGHGGIYAELERKFAQYHGLRYALSTNSGTSALHSAFFGVGISPGDEVLCPSYTFLSTVMPVLQCGGVPVLCDSEPDTGNIDPSDVEAKITGNTKAIVVTHVWGHPCEMDSLIDISRRHNLRLIEDCSHAHGATFRNRKVGTFGDVGAWSLQAKKIVVAGEGGMLLTNDQTVYERATLLGHFRVRSEQTVTSQHYSRYSSTGFGLNYRMHPLGAAIANVEFDKLDERIQARAYNLTRLSRLLSDIPGISPPITRPYVSRGAFYGYKPLYEPEQLGGLSKAIYIAALQAEGVDIHDPGSKPLHLLPFFQSLDDGMFANGWPRKGPGADSQRVYSRGDLPKCEKYHSRALSLPTFTETGPLVDDLLEQYGRAFTKVARHFGDLDGNGPSVNSGNE